MSSVARDAPARSDPLGDVRAIQWTFAASFAIAGGLAAWTVAAIASRVDAGRQVR
jgi:hypothetical protein